MKPVEERCLLRALDKIERLRGVGATPPEWKNVLAQLAGALRQPAGSAYPERIASRLGERIQLLEVARITHCFARDKLTYAAMDGKNYVVDHTVAELEEKLDPRQFVRIHRSTLVNIAWVREDRPAGRWWSRNQPLARRAGADDRHDVVHRKPAALGLGRARDGKAAP